MNQNAQTERYKLLVSHLNSYQRNDCYYSSACFLLSTDSRLTELSLPHISHDGIDFLAILLQFTAFIRCYNCVMQR